MGFRLARSLSPQSELNELDPLGAAFLSVLYKDEACPAFTGKYVKIGNGWYLWEG